MFGDGEWHTDGLVLVIKYTQTRQMWLGAKTVKSGHGRRYKRRLLPCTKREGKKRRNNKEKKGKNHSNNHVRGITKKKTRKKKRKER